MSTRSSKELTREDIVLVAHPRKSFMIPSNRLFAPLSSTQKLKRTLLITYMNKIPTIILIPVDHKIPFSLKFRFLLVDIYNWFLDLLVPSNKR